MYEMNTMIPFTQCGAGGVLKLHSAVGMMMDCCQFQEYQEKSFWDFLRSRNLAVFLFSMQLDILRFPAFRENVKTKVKIYGCRSIYGLRRITMRDESGALCMISNATGAFFDTKAGRAIKLDPAELGVQFDDAEPMETLPRKIPVPVSGGIKTPAVQVTVSRMDPNGHLTSPEYFSFAQDALPENYQFNRVRFEFKKQARFGEEIFPVRFENENGSIVIDLQDREGLSYAVAEFSTADLEPERNL